MSRMVFHPGWMGLSPTTHCSTYACPGRGLKHRCRWWIAGLVLIGALGAAPAWGDALPEGYPGLSSGIGGSASYHYDSRRNLGLLRVESTPYLLSVGPRSDQRVRIESTPEREWSQTLLARIGPDGQVDPFDSPEDGDEANRFEIRGRIQTPRELLEGVLLRGVPRSVEFRTAIEDALGDQGGSNSSRGLAVVQLDRIEGPLRDRFGASAELVLDLGIDGIQSILAEQGRLPTRNFEARGVEASLLAQANRRLVVPAPEPSLLWAVLVGLAVLSVGRVIGWSGGGPDGWPRRGRPRLTGRPPRRPASRTKQWRLNRPESPTAYSGPHFRFGGPAPGSNPTARQSP